MAENNTLNYTYSVITTMRTNMHGNSLKKCINLPMPFFFEYCNHQ